MIRARALPRRRPFPWLDVLTFPLAALFFAAAWLLRVTEWCWRRSARLEKG